MTGRTLQLTLPEDDETEIAAAVAAGDYISAEAAVADAIADWRENRRLDASLERERLRDLWREGIESGRGAGLSIEELKREASLRAERR